MKEGFRDAVEGSIAEVQARYDVDEYHCLARCHGEGVPNFSYAAQVMVCQSTCVAHVPVHVHRIIQHYANIRDVRLGTQSFSFDMYNNWPWVTCGCGGHFNDFCLAAVESVIHFFTSSIQQERLSVAIFGWSRGTSAYSWVSSAYI